MSDLVLAAVLAMEPYVDDKLEEEEEKSLSNSEPTSEPFKRNLHLSLLCIHHTTSGSATVVAETFMKELKPFVGVSDTAGTGSLQSNYEHRWCFCRLLEIVVIAYLPLT